MKTIKKELNKVFAGMSACDEATITAIQECENTYTRFQLQNCANAQEIQEIACGSSAGRNSGGTHYMVKEVVTHEVETCYYDSFGNRHCYITTTEY